MFFLDDRPIHPIDQFLLTAPINEIGHFLIPSEIVHISNHDHSSPALT